MSENPTIFSAPMVQAILLAHSTKQSGEHYVELRRWREEIGSLVRYLRPAAGEWDGLDCNSGELLEDTLEEVGQGMRLWADRVRELEDVLNEIHGELSADKIRDGSRCLLLASIEKALSKSEPSREQ